VGIWGTRGGVRMPEAAAVSGAVLRGFLDDDGGLEFCRVGLEAAVDARAKDFPERFLARMEPICQGAQWNIN
jgi:hypothetical protein